MPKNRIFLWNKDKTASVDSSKIREFTKYPFSNFSQDRTVYPVKGWYDKNECFEFGWFDTEVEALAFIENMHKEIENKT